VRFLRRSQIDDLPLPGRAFEGGPFPDLDDDYWDPILGHVREVGGGIYHPGRKLFPIPRLQLDQAAVSREFANWLAQEYGGGW
jgi:hypothetical protein